MATMDGLAKQREIGGGRPQSLAALGYSDVGLDNGWNSCGEGVNGSYHDRTGHVMVNSAFPSLRDMNSHAHSLNLTSSWYLNADGCAGETRLTATHYMQDAKDAVALGFDGVKFDTQPGGPNHNITEWAMALNATGKEMMIENCLDKHPAYLLTDPEQCPFNFYRSGSDGGPSFLGAMNNLLESTEPYLNVTHPVPASRPGCWAYPDMLEIGAPAWNTALKETALQQCGALSFEEERTIFASYAIISSPLILSFDVTNDTEVERLWPIIANERVLSINGQWDGEAGHVLKRAHETFVGEAGNGITCNVRRNKTLPSWVVWSKRLADHGSLAALAINLGSAAQSIEVTLQDLVGAGAGAGGELQGVDVWTNDKMPGLVTDDHAWQVHLDPHSSDFVVFSPLASMLV